MIINEKEIKFTQVLEIGKQMMIAARTAPKGKGVDNLELIVITGDDLNTLADYMIASVEKHGRHFFSPGCREYSGGSGSRCFGYPIK